MVHTLWESLAVSQIIKYDPVILLFGIYKGAPKTHQILDIKIVYLFLHV